MADGKKRGRKPRSVSPVTLTIEVTGDPAMMGRVDNIIDDLPQVAEILSAEANDDGTGFSYRLKFKTGPEGRLARKGIFRSLTNLKSKGRILQASIATNVMIV